MRRLRMLLAFTLIAGLLTVLGCQALVRSLLFYPTHHVHDTPMSSWKLGDTQIGYAREVTRPQNVWLFLHGNGGQASHRAYALPAFDERDAVFVLEYPGYGQRGGRPSRGALDAASREAYHALRERFPGTPVCVLGESLGSGPAALLSRELPAPDKIVLVVPFDSIQNVGRRHAGFLPARLILAGNWDNVAALRGFQGPVEIFGAERDEVIPVAHAQALAKSIPQAKFHLIPGGHGWADGSAVKFRCP